MKEVCAEFGFEVPNACRDVRLDVPQLLSRFGDTPGLCHCDEDGQVPNFHPWISLPYQSLSVMNVFTRIHFTTWKDTHTLKE